MNYSCSTDTIKQYLQTIPIFKECSNDVLSSFSQHACIKPLKKGQVIFLSDEPATHLYVVLSGWISLFRETEDGEQAIIDILTTDALFGDTALFDQQIYSYSAEASDECKVIAIPLSVFKKEIETNHAFTLSFLSSISAARKKQDMELEHRILQTAPQRIGCFLLKLHANKKDDKTVITLPYDKTLIAARLGMKPETFSRALGKLKKEVDGMVVKGSTIELNELKDLATYSCRACSSISPCKT